MKEFLLLCFNKKTNERPTARELLKSTYIMKHVGDLSHELHTSAVDVSENNTNSSPDLVVPQVRADQGNLNNFDRRAKRQSVKKTAVVVKQSIDANPPPIIEGTTHSASIATKKESYSKDINQLKESADASYVPYDVYSLPTMTNINVTSILDSYHNNVPTMALPDLTPIAPSGTTQNKPAKNRSAPFIGDCIEENNVSISDLSNMLMGDSLPAKVNNLSENTKSDEDKTEEAYSEEERPARSLMDVDEEGETEEANSGDEIHFDDEEVTEEAYSDQENVEENDDYEEKTEEAYSDHEDEQAQSNGEEDEEVTEEAYSDHENVEENDDNEEKTEEAYSDHEDEQVHNNDEEEEEEVVTEDAHTEEAFSDHENDKQNVNDDEELTDEAHSDNEEKQNGNEIHCKEIEKQTMTPNNIAEEIVTVNIPSVKKERTPKKVLSEEEEKALTAEFTRAARNVGEYMKWTRLSIDTNNGPRAFKFRTALRKEKKVLKMKYRNLSKARQLAKEIRNICHECETKFPQCLPENDSDTDYDSDDSFFHPSDDEEY